MTADDPEVIVIPYLGTFSKAAEVSSFTEAARALGLSQAAVSQRIHALEESLGTSLFRRQSGRVSLTDAGRRLYDHAQRILALYREARQDLTGLKAPVTGDLDLAASSIPGEHLLPALLGAYRRNYPHVRVRVTVAGSRAVVAQVERGQAHVGFVGARLDHPALDFRPIARDELVLVVPPGHAWARKSEMPLEQFLSEPLVLREEGSGTRACLEQALAQVGKSVRDLAVALELGSNEAIKEAVRQGLGAAVLSTHAVRQELEGGELRALGVRGLALARDVFAVHNKQRPLPIPARLLLDIMDDTARNR